jgi:DNA-directed RNA polymerase subunit K/omega
MIQLPENFDSIFRYIVVVSQRAEQLINGAKPRADSRHEKPTLEAKDDVDAGLVPWRVLSQAEIDAQRQAIVDQFRAEVAGEGFDPEAAQPIPDVLPTGAKAAGEVAEDGDDRDDELARLQRLLGMVGQAEAGDEDEDEDGESDDDEEFEEVSLESEIDLEPDEDDEEDEG